MRQPGAGTLSNMTSLQLDISSLVREAQAALLGSTPFLVSHRNVEDLAANNHSAEVVGLTFNIYALWSRPTPESAWTLMYIGERHSHSGLERLGEHLFKVGKGTQSKLEEVRSVLCEGAQMGVTVILVEPESMRLAIEEELLQRNSLYLGQLPWNKKGVTRAKFRVSPPEA